VAKRLGAWWLLVLVLAPAALWGASTGISTLQTKTAAPGAITLSGVAASEGTSLSHARADHVHSISGVVGVTSGGTGAAPGAGDQVLVSDSSSGATWRTLTTCAGADKAVNYDASTNAFSCNTFSGSGLSYANAAAAVMAGF